MLWSVQLKKLKHQHCLGGGGNMSKMFQNRILLPSVSILLSPIVAPKTLRTNSWLTLALTASQMQHSLLRRWDKSLELKVLRATCCHPLSCTSKISDWLKAISMKASSRWIWTNETTFVYRRCSQEGRSLPRVHGFASQRWPCAENCWSSLLSDAIQERLRSWFADRKKLSKGH